MLRLAVGLRLWTSGCARGAGGRTAAAVTLLTALLGVGGWVSGSPIRAEEGCLECHDLDVDRLSASVHGFLDCLDCHPAADQVPHAEGVLASRCVDCHEEATEQYAGSIHGWQLTAGDPMVTGCRGCHGPAHEIRAATDPDSPTDHRHLAETCGGCHSTPELATRSGIHLYKPLGAYTESVHARAVEAGKGAATCTDCHGSHLILRASDVRSLVHHSRIAQTCGGCHGEIAADYETSVHGRALAQGVRESPTCTDCHGEHRILAPQQRDSPVYSTNIPMMTCGRCHSDIRLSEKYGIPSEQVQAYRHSYHGLAARAGRVTVANCASCHGVHDILPSSDPASHTNAANLSQTCGQCHAGAGQRFAIGPVHVLPEEPAHPVVYWVRLAYIWLVLGLVGFMVLHNGLDLLRKIGRPPARPAAAELPGRERLCRGFRVAHGLLAGSFLVLVYSGFALTYPEAWWASPLTRWEEEFDLRGSIHRGAALVLLLSALVHVGHLARDRAARVCIRQMRPAVADWRELKHRVAYLLGRRDDPPRVPWVGYPEKLEYLAVVWGTVIMALTGFALWFENFMLRWFPSWVVDLATVIHFYEAVLASLAILVWHFYAVIFDPVVYPIDMAWWHGRSAPGRELERLEAETSVPGTVR